MKRLSPSAFVQIYVHAEALHLMNESVDILYFSGRYSALLMEKQKLHQSSAGGLLFAKEE